MVADPARRRGPWFAMTRLAAAWRAALSGSALAAAPAPPPQPVPSWA
jgi:hypothetical protein